MFEPHANHSELSLAAMEVPYFYEAHLPDTGVLLSESSFHHAAHVLRMRAGQELFVTDGKGKLVHGRINELNKKSCSLDVLAIHHNAHPEHSLHMAISFTKNAARMEWFLEKACEIGIQRITPLICKRSEKLFFKRERFDKILISAMLQSKQSYLPLLQEPTSIEDVLQGSESIKCIAHCVSSMPRNSLATVLKPKKETLILIGPEGDFTPEEITLCLGQCQAVSLGDNRLRTETAGLFACVVFNTQLAST